MTDDPPEFTEDEIRAYSQQFDDIDEKTIQVQILVELFQIRRLLEMQHGELDQQDAPAQYRCRQCGAHVEGDRIESHAKTCFNWVTDMGTEALLSNYERLDTRKHTR